MLSYLAVAGHVTGDTKYREIMDELIDSICIVHQESLYSGNVKHFERIDDLNIFDWNKI